MKKPYVFEKDNEQYSLQDCVEICAVGIAESISFIKLLDTCFSLSKNSKTSIS